MNKNLIFKKFIQNPGIKGRVTISETQLEQLDLHTPVSDPLINVIKTAIIHLEADQSVDAVARKINQSFKTVLA